MNVQAPEPQRYEFSTPAPLDAALVSLLLAQNELLARELRFCIRKLVRVGADARVEPPALHRLRQLGSLAEGRAWWLAGSKAEASGEPHVLLGISPGLAYEAIDRMLGGPGGGTPPSRNPSPIEQDLGHRFLRGVFLGLARGLALKPAALEVRPDQAVKEPLETFLKDLEAAYIVLTMQVQIGEARHSLWLALDRRLLEERLRREVAAGGAAAMPAPLQDSVVRVVAELARCRVSMEDAAQLEPGDVVLFDAGPGALLDLCIAGKRKFRGRLGVHDGFYAVEVSELVGVPEKANAAPEPQKPAANKEGKGQPKAPPNGPRPGAAPRKAASHA